jgi:hypothetical protein
MMVSHSNKAALPNPIAEALAHPVGGRSQRASLLIPRFRKKPKPENGLAGFVHHVQSPFRIRRQSGDNILCQTCTDAECCISRGATVAQDIFDGGKLALLHLEYEFC